MTRPPNRALWTAIARIAATLLVVSPATAHAGGQGRGLPLPPHLIERNYLGAANAVISDSIGAPAPRWILLDDPEQRCFSPYLRTEPLAGDPSCYGSGFTEDVASQRANPACDCSVQGVTEDFRTIWLCVPLEGIDSSFPLLETFWDAACTVQAIPGSEHDATLSLRFLRESESDVSSEYPDQPRPVVRRQVALEIALELEGEIVSTQRLPSSGFQPLDVTTDEDGAPVFLDAEYPPDNGPISIAEVGWYDGTSFDCGGAWLGRALEIERVAAGGSVSLPRRELIALAQRLHSATYCEPDGSRECTYTPSLVFLEPNGTLTTPSSVSLSEGESVCNVHLRFSEPLTQCNDGIDNDLDGFTDYPADSACTSTHAEGEGLFGRGRLIDDSRGRLAIGDLDLDGDADVVSYASTTSNAAVVRWFENRIAERAPWSKHDIVTIEGYPDYGAQLVLADFDRDADLDVLLTTSIALLWLENPGPAEGESEWALHQIDDCIQSTVVADVDRDGDEDILFAGWAYCGGEPSVLGWLENRIEDGLGWARRPIPTAWSGSSSNVGLSVGDLDGDSDPDLVLNDGRISWYENRLAAALEWKERTIEPSFQSRRRVATTDLSGDGIPDVLVSDSRYYNSYWYENRLAQSAPWLLHSIAGDPATRPADLDGDGDSDLITDRRSTGVPAWRQNFGGSFGPITSDGGYEWDSDGPFAADLNADGNPDLVAVADGSVAWFENRLPPRNDSRSNALPLREGPTRGTLRRAAADGSTTCRSPAPMVWYRFTAPTNGTLEVDTCGSYDLPGVAQGVDPVLAIFDGTSELACNDDSPSHCGGPEGTNAYDSFVSTHLQAGESVDVGVMRYAYSFDGAFLLNTAFVSDVSNDARERAAELAIPAGGGAVETIGELSGASRDGESRCGESDAPDVWYRFTAPTDGAFWVDTCGTNDQGAPDAGTDTIVSLHAATELACNDDWIGSALPARCSDSDSGARYDSYAETTVASGETIWIRVSRFSTAADGPFVLHAGFDPRPPNDRREQALPLGLGETTGTLAGAWPDAERPSCGDPTSPGAWYRFEAPAEGVFHLCETSGYDGYSRPVIALFDGDGELACSTQDLQCYEGTRLAQGDTVLARVGRRTAATQNGAFHLEASFLPTPVNDLREARIPLSIGENWGTFAGAAKDGDASCETTGAQDVWYEFAAPSAGILRLNSCGSPTSLALALFAAEAEVGCNGGWWSASSEQPLACEEWNASFFAYLEVEVGAGESLVLRASRPGYLGYLMPGQGSFSIDAEFLPAPEPAAAMLALAALGVLGALRARPEQRSTRT